MENKIEEKVQWVKNNFFAKYIKEWMVEDLKSMLMIEKKKSGACNFPIAFYVLSCMDFLGYLSSDEEYGRTGRDTEKRIFVYADKFFLQFDKDHVRKYSVELTKQFRHGLGHEFFPKMGGCVSRVDGEKVIFKENEALILDADKLARAFIASVGNFEKLLSDETFCLQVFERQHKLLSRIST